MRYLRFTFLWLLLLSIPVLGGCGQVTVDEGDSRLKVVATTSIVGDVVAQIGGDAISLRILLPLDADPHSFTPAPSEVGAVANADLVFINGVGLEAFMGQVLENAGNPNPPVVVSDGIALRGFTGEQADDHGHDEADGHAVGMDPHVWMNPENVIIWVENITAALSAADPDHAEGYTQNAAAYTEKLRELDLWAKEQLSAVPENQRKLVTDHDSLGYFADHYGFEVVGTVTIGYSTLAEPSAKEIAALQTVIQGNHVPAIFVGTTTNTVLAERIAEDTGIPLVALYSGSLSEAGGPAATYLDYMRYNVNAIVSAGK